MIVTDSSPGPLELVEHDRSGLVVPAENPICLAEAIEALLSDDRRCARLGSAGRQRLASQQWTEIEILWRWALNLPVSAPEAHG